MGEIANIEKPVYKYAVEKGFSHRKAKWDGRRGAPDRLFFGKGRFFFVEFKDTGKEPEPHQWREIERFRKNGITVHVIDTVEAGCALFD